MRLRLCSDDMVVGAAAAAAGLVSYPACMALGTPADPAQRDWGCGRSLARARGEVDLDIRSLT